MSVLASLARLYERLCGSSILSRSLQPFFVHQVSQFWAFVFLLPLCFGGTAASASALAWSTFAHLWYSGSSDCSFGLEFPCTFLLTLLPSSALKGRGGCTVAREAFRLLDVLSSSLRFEAALRAQDMLVDRPERKVV